MRFRIVALAAALGLWPAAALAQAADIPPKGEIATTGDSIIDEGAIIVTATRRSESLSDVPIAVSAVSAEALSRSGGFDIRALNQLAPSLLISSATSEANGAARIRGIGTVGENPGLESSVALFIDGVYRARTGVGLTDIGEIQQIEVLRGPQGTLFGRNASAGLISVTTPVPQFEWAGVGEASYGNYNAVRLMGGITGPVSDKVAFRLDGLYNRRDGYLLDVVSDEELSNRNRWLVRGKLLIEPNDDLQILLIGDYSAKNEQCCGAAIISPTQNLTNIGGQVFTSPNSTRAFITSLGGQYVTLTNGDRYARETTVTPGASYEQTTRDWGVSGQIDYEFGGAHLTSITAYRRFSNGSAQDSDFNKIDILQRSAQTRVFETFSQELRLQGEAFDDRLDWLVGGYFANEVLTTTDNLNYGQDYEKFVNAQIGNTLGTLAALVGYKPPPGQSLLNGTGILSSGYFEQTSVNWALFTHNVVTLIPDKVQLTLGLRYTNERKSLESVFASDNNLCGALRNAPAFTGAATAYNAARAGATSLACVINNTTGPGFTSADADTTLNEDELTGTVVLSVTPTENLLTYLSYSRGYKAGGFNLDTAALDIPCNVQTDTGSKPLNIPSCAQRLKLPANTKGNGRPEAIDLQFAPEIVNAFELGAKLNLGRFSLNAALFYQAFNDFQLNTFNGVNFEVTNINGCSESLGGRDTDLVFNNSECFAKGKAGVNAKGLELEAVMTPVDTLTFTAGATFASTKYAENLTGFEGSSLSPVLFQLPGRTMSNATDYVVTGSMSWTPQISEKLSGLVYMDFRFNSDLNTGSDLDLEKTQPSYTIVNMRLGIYGENQRWGIELWGTNIFNTLFQQVGADATLQGSGTWRAVANEINPVTGLPPTANQIFITFPAEPRFYGVTVRGRF